MRKPFKTQNAAVTAGFFIAPILPAISIPLVGPWRFRPDVIAALIMYVIDLPVVFLIGLPLLLLFSRFQMFSWWGAMMGGGIGGGIIIALVVGRHNLLHGYSLPLYASVGAATGLAFWAVVMLGPEPSQSMARNWVDAFRRRRD